MIRPVENGGSGGIAKQRWLDGAAVAGTVACLIHCLLLPLLIAAVPALSSALELPETFHRNLLIPTVPASALALHFGHRRHGVKTIAAFGLGGLSLLGLPVVGGIEGDPETALTLCGSLLLAGAHMANWRSSRGCA